MDLRQRVLEDSHPPALDSSSSGWGLVDGSCKHCNEPSGSIKCREVLGKLNVLLASREGLCSVG
jgi:hypothetical protein